MNHGIKQLRALGGAAHCDCHLLRWQTKRTGAARSQHTEQLETNVGELRGLIDGWGLQEVMATSIELQGLVREFGRNYHPQTFEGYSDVVLDVSALPREIFYPVLSRLLRILDEKPSINLHLFVTESPSVDQDIQQEGDQADLIPGFEFLFESIAEEHEQQRIWVPVLGENHEPRLRKIHEKINPHIVCPVVPFPSRSARRGDELIIAYQDLLSLWKVDLRDIMYVSENNPFDIYRRLRRVKQHYSAAFEPLGKVQVAVSALSSKLLSIGVCLSAWEEELPVYHAGGLAYEMATTNTNSQDWQLYSLWIAGEPYE